MIRRLIKILLALLLVVIVVLLGSGWWLLHTDSGSGWLVGRIVSSQNGTLGIDGFSGNLSAGARARSVVLTLDSGELTVSDLRLRLQPLILNPGVSIEELTSGKSSFNSAATPASASTETGPSTAIEGLPLRIELHSVSLGTLVVDESVIWDRLLLTADVEDRLNLDQLTITGPFGSARANGFADLASPHNLNLQAEGELSGSLAGTAQPLIWSLDASGDTSRTQIKLQSQGPRFEMAGNVLEWDSAPVFDLHLHSPQLKWPVDSELPVVQLDDLNVELSGPLTDFNWQLDTLLHAEGLRAARLAVSGSGHGGGLNASSFFLQDQNHHLSGTMQMRWAPEPGLDANLQLHALTPSAWLEQWPMGPLSGHIQANLSPSRINIDRLQLTGQQSPVSLQAFGHWSPESEIANLTARWSSLSWPLTSEGQQLDSANGELVLTGRPDDWQLRGHADLATNAYPAGTLEIQADGDLQHARVNALKLDALGGVLTGQAGLNWDQAPSFDAQLNLVGLAVGELVPGLSAAVNGAVDLAGNADSGDFRFKTPGLTTAYRDRPLLLQGAISRTSGNWLLAGLELVSDQTRILANGDPMSGDGLNFSATGLQLQHWQDEVAGRIDASGMFSLRGPAGENSAINLDVIAESLEVSGQSVPLAEIHYVGDNGQQTLELSADLDGGSLRMLAAGVLEKPLEADNAAWRGSLQSLQLKPPWDESPQIELKQAAPLHIDGNGFGLQDACLAVGDQGEACIDLASTAAGEIMISTRLAHLPLQLAGPLLGPGLQLTQALSGEVSMLQRDGQLIDTDANMSLSAGQVLGDDTQALRTGEGLLSWTMIDGRLIEIKTHLPLPDIGDLLVEGSLQNPDAGVDAGISGSVWMTVEDLGFISKLAPEVDHSAGRLKVRLDYTGSVGQPQIAGVIDLSDGELEYQPLGLQLTNIDLDGVFPVGAPAEASGRFRAGDGEGQLEGRLGFDGMVPDRFSLSIRGDRLVLADIPELSVMVSPDLNLEWLPGLLKLDGRIDIPKALLAPKMSLDAVKNESSDIEVIDGAEFRQIVEPEAPMAISGSIEVALGEEVHVDLAGARAQLGGNVVLNWTEDEPVPLADGAIAVTGEYKAYGQLLEIEDSSIRFPDVPADNPRLNIRAVREIYGSRKVEQAGVWVTGTAQRPDIRLYTNPTTSEEKAFSFLVTGSDFDYAGGVGAVSLGTYVLPRLYVSYGIGLFDTGNVISGRFDLSRRWGIKASSGERDTGVDVSFTVDR